MKRRTVGDDGPDNAKGTDEFVYDRKETYDNINSLWDVDDYVMPRAKKPYIGVLCDAMDYL